MSFVSARPSMFPKAKPRETLTNIEFLGRQNPLFPAGPVIKCFVIPPNLKLEKNCEEIVCFTLAGSQFCFGLNEHGLITFEWKVHVFVFLVSFVRPRELVSFDLRKLTCFPPIGERI